MYVCMEPTVLEISLKVKPYLFMKFSINWQMSLKFKVVLEFEKNVLEIATKNDLFGSKTRILPAEG